MVRCHLLDGAVDDGAVALETYALEWKFSTARTARSPRDRQIILGPQGMALMQRIDEKAEWLIEHQSHYTSLVRKATVTVEEGPILRGPLSNQTAHWYRQCQYLRVINKDNAAKPIGLFNLHSPASGGKPLKHRFAAIS